MTKLFYQNPGSDSMFLIAIAVMASIVLVFIVVGTFILLRSENKKNLQTPPKERPEDSLPSIPSVEVVAAPPPQEVPEPGPLSIPSFEVPAWPPEERPKVDPPPVLPVEIAASSPAASPKDEVHTSLVVESSPKLIPNERPKINFEFSQRTKALTLGVLFTALLMFALDLGLWYAYRNASMLAGFYNPYGLWSSIVIVMGAALAGAIGGRIAHLGWRQIIVAALLAGAGMRVFASLTDSAWIPTDLFLLIYIPGGVFLLPLFDPAVRRAGPAPSTWKVVLAALLLSLLIIRSTLLNSPFGVFIFPLPGLGVVLGLLLSFSTEKNRDDGAWVGGLFALVPPALLAMLLLPFGF